MRSLSLQQLKSNLFSSLFSFPSITIPRHNDVPSIFLSFHLCAPINFMCSPRSRRCIFFHIISRLVTCLSRPRSIPSLFQVSSKKVKTHFSGPLSLFFTHMNSWRGHFDRCPTPASLVLSLLSIGAPTSLPPLKWIISWLKPPPLTSIIIVIIILLSLLKLLRILPRCNMFHIRFPPSPALIDSPS